MGDIIEIAITLGIKEDLRELYTKEQLVERVYDMFKLHYSKCSMIFSIEDYSSTGYHIHIYYKGPKIYWKVFNQRWGLGYVKNRNVYDRDGWIKYIKKQGSIWMYNGGPITTEVLDDIIEDQTSLIEQMSGMSIFEYMDSMKSSEL